MLDSSHSVASASRNGMIHVFKVEYAAPQQQEKEVAQRCNNNKTMKVL